MQLPLLILVRLTLLVIFATSLKSKLFNIPNFESGLHRLNFLPKSLVSPVARFLLLGEFLVVAFLIIGGDLLVAAFLLSAALLIAYTISIGTALAQRIQTSCNCFGLAERPISGVHILRNSILLGLSFLGAGLAGNTNSLTTLSFIELVFLFFAAGLFATLMIYLSEIAILFAKTK